MKLPSTSLCDEISLVCDIWSARPGSLCQQNSTEVRRETGIYVPKWAEHSVLTGGSKDG